MAPVEDLPYRYGECELNGQPVGRVGVGSLQVFPSVLGPNSLTLNRVKQLERISIDPAIRFGKPCLRGTRVTVDDVLGYLGGGTSEEQLLTEFPQLSREDVRACRAYADERERRTVDVTP